VGRAIAEALAAAGYDLILHYHSSEAEATTVAHGIGELGSRAEIVRADLSDPEQISRPFEAAVRAFGGIDLLVNSAAIFPRIDPRDATHVDWDRVFALNARAPFLCAQQAALHMGPNGGAIINIGDTGATEAWPSYVPYVASKAALASLTRGLAAAFAPHIRVNGVAPGAVLLPSDEDDETGRSAAARRTVLGRVGRAADVADAVVYLAGATYVTGVILRVDGGQHLKGPRTAG
jgi:pteridine reductase